MRQTSRIMAKSIILFILSLLGTKGNYVKIFEYGIRIPGDALAHTVGETVPAFQPLYSVNISHNDPNFQRQYTYIKVEYMNLISIVKVSYNASSFMLNFHVKFPLTEMPFLVLGYANPIYKRRKRSQKQQKSRKYIAEITFTVD